MDLFPFLLHDTIRIDRLAFESLLGARPSLAGWRPSRSSVAILESLAADGHVVLDDYRDALGSRECDARLDAMICADLASDHVVEACRRSLKLWIQFYVDLLRVNPSRLRKTLECVERGRLGEPEVLAYAYECVSDINRNTLLAEAFESPLFEWEDYSQYYRLKTFPDPSSDHRNTLESLFEAFLPNFELRTYSELLDLRGDSRLDAVRKLAGTLDASAVDDGLVVRAYQDVMRFRNEVETYSRYIGYIALVIGLSGVPGAAWLFQRTADALVQKGLERPVRWQVFFVERSVRHSHAEIEMRLRSFST